MSSRNRRLSRESLATCLVLLAAALLFSASGCSDSAGEAAEALENQVLINGDGLSEDQLAQLAQQFQLQIPPGNYWYDSLSGAWGFRGGPAQGIIYPGIPMGGQLAANASDGDTGVFINGRELHRQDLGLLMQIVGTTVPQGRYWLDAQGNYGFEGGPLMGNLAMASRAGGGNQAGNYFLTGGAVIGDASGAVGFIDSSGRSVTLP